MYCIAYNAAGAEIPPDMTEIPIGSYTLCVPTGEADITSAGLKFLAEQAPNVIRALLAGARAAQPE